MREMGKKAVVLLSGGIDSTTTLFWAKDRGYECHTLIFDYGQRHKRELESAKKISRYAGCEYKVLKIKLPWKGSSLIDRTEKLPKRRSFKEIAKGIPSSYVPARNMIFLSFATSFAEAIGAERIFIGANAVDFSGYPDCRPIFLKAFENAAEKGTKIGFMKRSVKIKAPLLMMKKSQIIKKAVSLKVPFEYTWSCYEGWRRPCRSCDSCIIRRKGFEEAGIKDPLS